MGDDKRTPRAEMCVNVTVLGPVRAVSDGAPIALGGPKPTTLVALLALHADTVVTTDQIADVLWRDHLPANIRSTIHTYVSTLRRALGPEVLERRSGGYLLSAVHATVDLDQARTLAAEGRELAKRGHNEDAVERLQAALALWRGDIVLAGATGDWADTERARLANFRLGLQEDLLDAALAVDIEGMPADELSALVEQHPVRERLRGQLIRTLVLAGRTADAVSCYQEGCRALADELGARPGPELQSIGQRLLFDEPPAEPVVPRQLPADIADFTGRADELRRITASHAPVVALAGKPGAGKSSLAVHIGHAVRDRFADGELYADLRGTHGTPRRAIDVLGQFLRALGVADAAVPVLEDECVALYRTLLADRAVLVVLDDAADEEQVRRLLPSGPGCQCLITSRTRLAALAGAVHVDVRTLTESDALDLFGRLVGQQRLAREPDQAKEIVRLCGRLPLAIRVAGARLAARPDWQLTRLAERLREQHRILNELSAGDLEVRGSLNLELPGPVPAAAAGAAPRRLAGCARHLAVAVSVLTGDAPADAEDIAEELLDAQLLDTVSTAASGDVRYRLHDLTRVFGWERAQQEEPADELAAVVARVAEHCAGLVHLASDGSPVRLLRSVLPARYPVDLAECEKGLAGREPLAWLAAEQANLVHVVERASELGLVGEAARLATMLCSSVFAINNHFTYWSRTHTAALEAARRAGDLTSQGLLLAGLGWLRREQDRLDEAVDCLEQGSAAFELAGHADGALATQMMLCGAQRESGRLRDALRTVERAWPAAMATGESEVAARAYHGRGVTLTELGRLPEARRMCQRVAEIYERLGGDHGVGLSLRSVGIAHRAAGEYEQAAACCERAVVLLRAAGDRLMTVYAGQALAKVRIRQGQGAAVRESLNQGLRTCRDCRTGSARR